MELTLTRDYFGAPMEGREGFTLGTLLADGVALGHVVEDTDRRLELHPEAKVYGQTCIPRGRYRVVLSFSHKFQKVLPEILNVPNYTGVRIHGGNKAEDSAGCPILGRTRTYNGVKDCAGPNARLMELLQRAEDAGQECWITVR